MPRTPRPIGGRLTWLLGLIRVARTARRNPSTGVADRIYDPSELYRHGDQSPDYRNAGYYRGDGREPDQPGQVTHEFCPAFKVLHGVGQ